jgi:uncharacterized Fe-S cluster protein YjdI
VSDPVDPTGSPAGSAGAEGTPTGSAPDAPDASTASAPSGADDRAPSPDVARPAEPTPIDAHAAPRAGVRRYTRDGAAVTYEVALCRHAGECVRGLPAVFDTTRRPWIQPQNASIDDLERVIALCPTRALKFERDTAIKAPATTA